MSDARRFRIAAALLAVGVALALVIAVVPGLLRPNGPAPTGASTPGSTASSVPSSDVPTVEPTQPPVIGTPGPHRERALATTEVFGFLPYWKLGTAKPDFERLTTIAYFGVEAHRDGHLVRLTKAGKVPPGWAGWTSDAVTTLIQGAHAAKVRVVLTVQRFSWARKQARTTTNLLRDATARGALVRDIVAAVRERGADGVNLDFEPMPAAVTNEFTMFVRELRAGMNARDPRLQLTFDVTSGVSGYDVTALTADDAADAVLVMGYDYRVGTASTAGSTAPLASDLGSDLRASIATASGMTAPDRIILGLPWYGRSWSTVSPDAHAQTQDAATYGGSETVEYSDALLRAGLFGRRYDPNEASAWTAYRTTIACPGCQETWRQLWYDDVDSFRAKVDLALESGLRGVGIWVLGYEGDHPELWTVLRLALTGAADGRAPSGTVELAPTGAGSHGGAPVVTGAARLRLTAGDGANGSGVVFVRVSLLADIADGELASGVTYPAVDQLLVSPNDPAIGGSGVRGERTFHVQWRDVSGNWSKPVSVAAWYRPGIAPSPSPSPVPLESLPSVP